MTQKKSTPADPELLRQLDAADANQPVAASFTLRPPKDSDRMEAQEVHQKVDEVVKSAEEAGQKIHDIYVMASAQAFNLTAPPGVIRAMLGSKDIAAASASDQPESMLIEPVPRPGPKGTRGGGKTRKGKA